MSGTDRISYDGTEGLPGLFTVTRMLEPSGHGIKKDRWCAAWLTAYAQAGGQHVARGSSWELELAEGAARAKALRRAAEGELVLVRQQPFRRALRREAAGPWNVMLTQARQLTVMWERAGMWAFEVKVRDTVMGDDVVADWEKRLTRALLEMATLWRNAAPTGPARALFMCLYIESRALVRVDDKLRYKSSVSRGLVRERGPEKGDG